MTALGDVHGRAARAKGLGPRGARLQSLAGLAVLGGPGVWCRTRLQAPGRGGRPCREFLFQAGGSGVPFLALVTS